MDPVIPMFVVGIFFHAVGAMLSANCYTPQKYVRRWSWETFWLMQAAWCWLLWPIIGAIATIPRIDEVVAASPKGPMAWAFLMGMAYGVGGTAFNISIRYIGFSLTYAIAVGLSSVIKTFVAPLVQGQLGAILAKTGSGWVMLGVALGVSGIAVCGLAGRLKEGDLRQQAGGAGEFSMMKGLLLSLVAGILSAVYGLAMEDVCKPIVETADHFGAGFWKGNIAYPFVNTGTFVTVLIYTVYLFRRNRTQGELIHLAAGTQRASLGLNYLLAMLTGTLWYGQFFFYNLGHVRMGAYEFTSWAIHMILLVLFSNLVALLFREWKGCRPLTRWSITLGLALLTAAILLMAYGNYLGDKSTLTS
jgi:L-rhamnose-H+ transport protein